MTRDLSFIADLSRYPHRSFLREQSLWAIWVYRYGRRVRQLKPGLSRFIHLRCHTLLFRIVEIVTGISLPADAQIGPGLRIYHFGNIFIHPQAIIGRNCTLRQGVTLGNVGLEGPVPVVEDDVEFGAYAQVFGNVRIGHGAKVGSMSLVLCDVPPGAHVLGNPARIMARADGAKAF